MTEFYAKKRKKCRRRKARIVLVIFLLILIGAFLYSHFVVRPLVVETTSHSIYSLSTSAVSDAVYDVLYQDKISYTDLVDTQFDKDGVVTFINLKTDTLNLLARKFYKVAQNYLDAMGKGGVDISIGTFTGIPIFAGLGSKVNIKLVSIGAMMCEFESRFTQAGINQTNHSLYIHLSASVSMLLPTYSHRVDSVTDMLVAESVIVGKIPSVYLEAGANLTYVPKT